MKEEGEGVGEAETCARTHHQVLEMKFEFNSKYLHKTIG